ncbi:hypothetical protein LSH36_17g03081 [Paralvinella palmiformis]|uniref:Tetratricopeptide repeat protein 7 N-terminal domain-containing protein n=1 Tax=Paralvinella palmiformis TaxID=53620 RepID=A0AAD9NFQ6_9ANNE|nr:hypothetical protein LSH36_17g03081 [Paralvinella palmiformis]
MATKGRVSRLESQIEKYRSCANWAKVLDVAKKISSKNPSLEISVQLTFRDCRSVYLILFFLSFQHKIENFAKFVQAECQLERFLLENPANEKNVHIAQDKLRPVMREIKQVIESEPKTSLREEAQLLLAKIHYAMGDYSATLQCYDEVGLENISLEKASGRKVKLIAEAFAIKGLCLEKCPMSSTSKYKMAEREEQIISCFEKAGDISIHQLQLKQDCGNKTPNSMTVGSGGLWNIIDIDNTGVGPIVETAIQRSPILYIRNGEISKGVSRFRELLRAVETRAVQGLRQTLARQLAEVLLRGVCEKTYEKVDLTSTSSTPTTSKLAVKPAKFSGDGLFVPKDENEETLLLLLISESIMVIVHLVKHDSYASLLHVFIFQATKEAILSRSPEHEDARLHTFNNSTAVYDLLTIALVKQSQYSILSEEQPHHYVDEDADEVMMFNVTDNKELLGTADCRKEATTFERSMKFSFDEFHIWYQYGLSLICAEKYTRALLVLKECMRLQNQNPTVCLLAAKLCYEKLHMIDEGIEYSLKATEIENNSLKARCFLTLGIGYSLKADQSHLHINRQKYQKKALTMFMRAVSQDSNDYLAYFHLALQQALLCQVSDAMKSVRRALHLQADNIYSLHLLALLLSAQKQHLEALNLMSATLTEYPDNFNLLFSKCKLEEVVHGPEQALLICKQMMTLWKCLFEPTVEFDNHRITGLMDQIMSADHHKLIQLQLNEMNERDSGSVRAESIAASKVEHTLSEVASSFGSIVHPKHGSQQTWSLLTQIWLRLGELYLKMEKTESAHACIQEASSIFPVSYTVSYMRGRLLEQRGEMIEAKKCYENAIAVNPAHVNSLQHLGTVLHDMGNSRQAEKILRDAVNVDPGSSKSWYSLGQVLEALGEFEAAADCLMTSVELETSSSVVPFTVVPKPLS